MRIAVLGSGPVGQAVAAKLATLGHEVIVGARNVEATMARTEPDNVGNPPFPEWAEEHPGIAVTGLAEAATAAELVVNATNGAGSIAALEAAGEENLAGKLLVDIANPLDFSGGMPPSLFVSNTDSLGEQIQRRFPQTRVVKALNTMNAYLMVDPKQLAGGDHTVFVSGDDADAKATVVELLESFGWSDIIDLGDITAARGTEMYLPLWLRIMGATQNPVFNIKVVR
ncbi:MAG: NAD(P)-binding domain-containing protein [Acidimicrobiia bacterium]